MTVRKEATIHRYIGLSTDAKPTSIPVGSTYYAYDTGVMYITYTGSLWAVKPAAYEPLIYKAYEEIVDCSGGGIAQTEALVTLSAGTVILEIITVCTEAFNGNTTKTFEVGIAANTDKYIDPVDCPVTLDGVMTMAGGTNNDQKSAEALIASTPLIATWTNNAAASAGKMKVKVIYF